MSYHGISAAAGRDNFQAGARVKEIKMGCTESLHPTGEKLKRAIAWISEITVTSPGKTRMEIIREAEIRFDLSPAECEFLDKNFSGIQQNTVP
jgi:hypothetical protein